MAQSLNTLEKCQLIGQNLFFGISDNWIFDVTLTANPCVTPLNKSTWYLTPSNLANSSSV